MDSDEIMNFGDTCNINGEFLEKIAKLKDSVASLDQEAIRVPVKDR